MNAGATPKQQLLAVYMEKRADLTRFLTARLRSAAAAEDLIQDLYVRLATLDLVGPVENPSAFLYRAATNLMLDRNRGERRAEARDQAWEDSRHLILGDTVAVDEASPEDAASSRQGLRQLIEAVDDLPPKTRRAFQLHKFEGHSQLETAALLGVSRKTIEKQLGAALKQLLAKLGERF